jgi:tryptophan synthase beta chain
MNYNLPDTKGYFGDYGGRFVPETLISPLEELTKVFEESIQDSSFETELNSLLSSFVGRPTPLYFANNLTKELGGARIYLKREDLVHTGAHKINNALGQILLAKKMGKSRVIAETGAGQHGVATATAAAKFGLKCVVYMGQTDMERQALNVKKMELLGAQVIPVTSGQMTLKESVNEAMRDWISNIKTTHYILGTAYGPHPYPKMVREFQRIIGKETKKQILEIEGRLPDYLVACVGGGSNAIGLFHDFIDDHNIKLIGVEAGGKSLEEGQHASRIPKGKLGILQGTKTLILCNDEGQILPTSSISAGLDYAAIGPEHSYLHSSRRGSYEFVSDEKALKAFHTLSKSEGIIPALESSHAIAYVLELAPKLDKNKIIIVNLSGRGDKDLNQIETIFKN